MGLTNTIATFPGFIGPAVVGAITYKNVSVLYCLLNANCTSFILCVVINLSTQISEITQCSTYSPFAKFSRRKEYFNKFFSNIKKHC